MSREDADGRVNVVGLEEEPCNSVQDLINLISTGNGQRVTGQTGANLDSSRSHAVLQINLKAHSTKREGVKRLKYENIGR